MIEFLRHSRDQLKRDRAMARRRSDQVRGAILTSVRGSSRPQLSIKPLPQAPGRWKRGRQYKIAVHQSFRLVALSASLHHATRRSSSSCRTQLRCGCVFPRAMPLLQAVAVAPRLLGGSLRGGNLARSVAVGGQKRLRHVGTAPAAGVAAPAHPFCPAGHESILRPACRGGAAYEKPGHVMAVTVGC